MVEFIDALKQGGEIIENKVLQHFYLVEKFGATPANVIKEV